MGKFCCFWCPRNDFSEHRLGDACPNCGRNYGAPLALKPTRIRDFDITQSVSRGFYGAAYRARQSSLDQTVVLKVVPVAVYRYFGKDWTIECREHANLAATTPFIARINDQFEDEVVFGSESLRCYVAVLQNIEGPTLEQVLDHPETYGLTARMAAQIGADLFEILDVFVQRQRFHNDLHAGNVIIQTLTAHSVRTGLDPSSRAVAIDLGSVTDASRSGDHHIGDQHHIARHLAALSKVLHSRPSASDIDFRMSLSLRGLAEHLSPAANAQRAMTVNDAHRALRTAITVDEPWRLPLSLPRFGDAYNAQALESWYIPQLWIDPENRWLTKTQVRGPQVITGMRGCGKTMLLRAMHFHARAAQANDQFGSEGGIEAIEKEGFLGIYASCQKLLDPQDNERGAPGGIALPFERLYVAYLRDAIQILRHLRSLDRSKLLGGVHDLLGDGLKPLKCSLARPDRFDEHSFEQFLIEVQLGLAAGEKACELTMAPSEAFAHLASVVRSSTPVFNNKYVFFLLDDVSTRYLSQEMVRTVISRLLFQNASCAFRITTEAQTLHRVLLSPGGITPADPSRDYEEFDLGNEVYRLLQEGTTRENMQFIGDILLKRGRQFPEPIYRRPALEVVGDVPLEEIARDITASSATSSERSRVYRGLRAIQQVCVGDLGDVVKIYEKILSKADANNLPVSAQKQSECFLEHSASLMHFLNRRDQHKKGLALAFAEAAGELLQQSARRTDGKPRLRQYTKLHVRVDNDPNSVRAADEILGLLDSGIFVYDGGVPRMRDRDDEPVLQFKLSYRKMLGLSSFIGLADRDRFELSGEALVQWLQNPNQAKQILLDSAVRVQGDVVEASDHYTEAPTVDVASQSRRLSVSKSQEAPSAPQPVQLDLEIKVRGLSDVPPLLPSLGLAVDTLTIEDLHPQSFSCAVIGLGFEDRAFTSAERLLNRVNVSEAVLAHYSEDQGRAISRLLESKGISQKIAVTPAELAARLKGHKNVVVDSSGLSKPFLFTAIKAALDGCKEVGVVHTLATKYYPSNDDIAALGVQDGKLDSNAFSRLSELVGERGPYKLVHLHSAPSDPTRFRALLASTSPKNDRLLFLLDQRDYDAVRILVPPPKTLRRIVARATAQLAASVSETNVDLIDVDTNDIEGALRATEKVFLQLYLQSGANLEIGLTGSKTHAIAFAAVAAAGRVADVWYVAPASYDRLRFTEGTGISRCFRIRLV